jgi:hypothetical protein
MMWVEYTCIRLTCKRKKAQISPTFTPVSVKEIPRFLQQAKKDGENTTKRAFRAWVRQQIYT